MMTNKKHTKSAEPLIIESNSTDHDNEIELFLINPMGETIIDVLNDPASDNLSDKLMGNLIAEPTLEIIEISGESDLKLETKSDSTSLPSFLIDQELLNEIEAIPDRFGFKIGDVADLLGIKQYVLRYWEQEFELLKPKKASNNQRLYTKKDVENAFLIRKLLYRDKFSIEGARQALKDVKFALKKEKDFTQVVQRIEFVQTQIKKFVDDIKKAKKIFN